MTKKMWDERYAESEYVYGTTPNTFFKQELDKLSPGKILLPAEGEGRNAVYAAEKGWNVWAFDQSETGRKKALNLAAEKNVMITYDLHDLNVPDYPVDFFDVVALVFVHSPSNDRGQIHRNLLRFLKPGGKVFLIGYTKEQLQFTTGGPRDEDLLFSLDGIKKDFYDTRILLINQMETVIEEGEYHRGKASVIQLVAEKQ